MHPKRTRGREDFFTCQSTSWRRPVGLGAGVEIQIEVARAKAMLFRRVAAGFRFAAEVRPKRTQAIGVITKNPAVMDENREREKRSTDKGGRRSLHLTIGPPPTRFVHLSS